jgi:hypothetical protein
MDRRVAAYAAVLAFAVVLVWGPSIAAASGADSRTATAGVTAARNGAASSESPAPDDSATPSPDDSAAPTTPTPTATASLSPTGDPGSSEACNDAIYGSSGGGVATAIVPGAAVIGGVVIHNRLPVATGGGVLNVEVVPTGEQPTPEAVPSVEWDLDGGAWQPINETFVPATGDASARWTSVDIAAPDIAAYGSRLFRMRIAFPPSTTPGHYRGVFTLAIPECAASIYGSNEVAFAYGPNVPPGPQAGSNGSSRYRGRILHVPLAPHAAAVPTTTHAVSAGATFVGQAGAPAAALLVGEGRASALSRDAGIGAAGLCGLLALLELIRWRRARNG